VDSFLLGVIIRVTTAHKPEVGVFLYWKCKAEFLLDMISGADVSRKEPSTALPHTSLRLRLETDK